ncbi:MAG: alpha-galactosidase [Oscillospiraceae bacterium]|nr:alpha-galactosidase [Oscillospiraceae bacterium]
MWRNEIADLKSGKLPFRFNYDGKCSSGFLDLWERETTDNSVAYFENKKNGGLVINAELTAYESCPAFDLKITLENTGQTNTKMIDVFSTLYFTVGSPVKSGGYAVHKAMGGLSTPEDFVQGDAMVYDEENFIIETAGGRSSNRDLPFFQIDTGRGKIIAAVGWTGQWKCELKNRNGELTLAAGMPRSHFVVYPGEKLVLGSMVALFWEGDPDEANNAFRQLLLERYIPTLPNRGKEPYIFCNTCFTRGGGWLNECDEQNQISLINALEPLDCESVITDAGWFTGGWPFGAGNWDADPLKYPGGIKPVADAAKSHNMKYGLWFELERAVAQTELAKKHIGWLLRTAAGEPRENENMLLNLGIPEAADYIYAILEDKITNDGIECYRQDFNMDPLVYWDTNDTPDRVGVTEIKYINGLYAYLDRIRKNHPGIFLDGCSSGGRRIDIEMLKRFHTHQKTDLWFDSAVDQNSLFSLSHYIPNAAFTAHINRYDDYSFNSVMAATLCLGWIADSEEQFMGNGVFEPGRAVELIERYKTARPYLNRSFYPLTAPDSKPGAAIAFEFFDKEKDSGVIFVFARERSAKEKMTISPKALKDNSNYILTDLATHEKKTVSGKTLKSGYTVDITGLPFSAVIHIEGKVI